MRLKQQSLALILSASLESVLLNVRKKIPGARTSYPQLCIAAESDELKAIRLQLIHGRSSENQLGFLL